MMPITFSAFISTALGTQFLDLCIQTVLDVPHIFAEWTLFFLRYIVSLDLIFLNPNMNTGVYGYTMTCAQTHVTYIVYTCHIVW